jgi:hypothetical protein
VNGRFTPAGQPVSEPAYHENIYYEGNYYQGAHYSLPFIQIGDMKILIDEITFLASDPGDSPANLDEALTTAFGTDSTGDSGRQGRDKNPEKKTGRKDARHSHREPAAGPRGKGGSQ